MRKNEYIRFLSILMLCIIVVTVFIACQGNNTPSAVTKLFLKSMNDNDFNTFISCLTEDMVEYFSSPMGRMIFSGVVFAYTQSVDLKNIKILNESINGDDAIVKVRASNGGETEFNLSKINGEWKIDVMGGTGLSF